MGRDGARRGGMIFGLRRSGVRSVGGLGRKARHKHFGNQIQSTKQKRGTPRLIARARCQLSHIFGQQVQLRGRTSWEWAMTFGFIGSAAVGMALLAACASSGADGAADFPSLLDRLENARTPGERGFDQWANGSGNAGRSVVQMLGAPETWDAYGTPALRQAGIARWRQPWGNSGGGML